MTNGLGGYLFAFLQEARNLTTKQHDKSQLTVNTDLEALHACLLSLVSKVNRPGPLYSINKIKQTVIFCIWSPFGPFSVVLPACFCFYCKFSTFVQLIRRCPRLEVLFCGLVALECWERVAKRIRLFDTGSYVSSMAFYPYQRTWYNVSLGVFIRRTKFLMTCFEFLSSMEVYGGIGDGVVPFKEW